jgi:enoyl-CoA hydratase
VVPAAELLDRARALLGQMLANAPVALALCIEAVNAGVDLPLDDAQRLEANQFGLAAATQDMAEGTRAFMDKRPAQFAGR